MSMLMNRPKEDFPVWSITPTYYLHDNTQLFVFSLVPTWTADDLAKLGIERQNQGGKGGKSRREEYIVKVLADS